MLYSCIHMATAGVKGLNNLNMFVFCLTWLTVRQTQTETCLWLTVNRFSEIANVREHRHVYIVKLTEMTP